MSKYELAKKLDSFDDLKGLKSTTKMPRYKLFARNLYCSNGSKCRTKDGSRCSKCTYCLQSLSLGITL
jgi:hypothetical protein